MADMSEIFSKGVVYEIADMEKVVVQKNSSISSVFRKAF